MPNTKTPALKAHDHAFDAHESVTELRDLCNQYSANMMDLLFESQKENLKLIGQIQKSLLKQGKSLRETLQLNGNGYAASHKTSSNDVMKSFMDISALMLDAAYQAAEKSAHIAKDSIGKHASRAQSVHFNGKR